MRSKHLLLMLLLALMAPWAAMAQCEISYELADSWGDGWNGGALVVTDNTTSTQLVNLTISSGSSLTGTIPVTDGHEIGFAYTAGSYAYENSWVIYDPNGTILWEGDGGDGNQSFSYTAVCPSCIKPTLSNTVTTTTTTATITWTPSGNNQTYFDIYWSTSSTAPTEKTDPSAANQTGTSYQITGLTNSTRYYVWIRGNCGTPSDPDVSGGWTDAVQFDTECLPATPVPWTETFEGYTGVTSGATNNLPVCWNYINECTNASYLGFPNVYYQEDAGHSGSNMLRLYSNYSYDPQDQYAILPSMDGINGLRIKLYARVWSTSYNAAFTVGVMTDPDDANTFVPVETITPTTTSWTDYTINLSSYTGTGSYIAFKIDAAYSASGHYYHEVIIDDITVEEIPSCVEPSGLAVSEITDNSAKLSWTAGASETNWQICLNDDMEHLISATTNPYTIALDPETVYSAKVRAYCNASDQSAWTEAIEFRTDVSCQAPTVLTIANLEATTATFGWTSEANSFNLRYAAVPTTTPLEYKYDNGTKSGNIGTNGGQFYWGVMFPANTFTENNIKKVAVYDIMAMTGQLLIYNDGTTYPTNLVYTKDIALTGADQMVDIDVAAPIDKTKNTWIVFFNQSGTTYPAAYCANTGDANGHWISFNNAQWSDINDLGSFSATWMIRAYVDASSSYTWTNKTSTTNSYSLTGLSAETDYIAQVQTNCGGTDGTSAWAITEFTTTELCPAPTGLAVSDETGHGATFTWTGTSDSYKVMVGEASETTKKSYDFEDNKISTDFTNSTTYPWTVTDADKHGGTYSVKSASNFTSNDSDLKLVITLDNPGYVSFWAKVSSEAGWDYGRFLLDGSQKFEVSGTDDVWTKYEYELTAGNHTLIWRFHEDISGHDGDDCFYVDDITIKEMSFSSWLTYTTEESPYILNDATHINAETTYGVKVIGVCENIDGNPTNIVIFTTTEDCPTPTDLAASNFTQNTADITWTANTSVENYTVQYRTAAGLDPTYTEGFEDETEFANWTLNNCVSGTGRNTDAKRTGEYGFKFSYNGYNSGITPPQYLISPDLSDYTANDVMLSFYYTKSYSSYTETFKVGWSSTTNAPSEFTWDNEILATSEWLNYSHTIPANTKYISIAYTADDHLYLYIDDLAIGDVVPAGSWNTASATAPNTGEYTIIGLATGTEYDVQVKANCGNTYCDYISFTTLAEGTKVFTNAANDGKWGTSGNWVPSNAPAITDNVIIRANATIESGCVAEAKKITFEGSTTPTLTIADGGQLKTDNTVTATVKKSITKYTGTKDQYYLIGNPLSDAISSYTWNTPNTTSVGLVTSTSNYDLYSWSRTSNLEWSNYKVSSFSLSNGTGYLYANAADVELTFTGIVKANKAVQSAYVSYTAPTAGTTEFSDWNLLANPFVCDAYLVNASENGTALSYYKMNTAGNGFEAVTGGTAIDPVQGIFYKATESGYVYFTRTAPGAKDGQLNMNLRSGIEQIDNAILVFGSEQKLEKFSFRANSSKIYMPVEGKDYAITNAEPQGEMPVSFKAENNGSYTLSFNTENVEFGYLHLIDNMTGMDVDLLQNPSYSFEAKTTDYASRFKLVFSTGNGVNEESFAFISDGNIILNGEGMLQVVDVMGRIMMQEENATSVSTSGMTPGVYVLRLINGDSVRTQKIIVK